MPTETTTKDQYPSATTSPEIKVEDDTSVQEWDGIARQGTVPYKQGMRTFRIERFNVVIPEGSTSQKIETALIPITAEMNQTRLVVNPVTYQRNLKAQQEEVDKITEDVRSQMGNPKFRPNASADCSEYFLKQKKYPILRTTDSGKASMDAEVIEEYAHQFNDPIASRINDCRKTMSGLSQLNKWEEFAKKLYVQTTWDSLGTPMGRYTSEKPCLNNRVVPIRETIEAPMGYQLLSLDLGQAEYVAWASLSKDAVLSKTFEEKKDLHLNMWQMLSFLLPKTFSLHGEPERQYGKMVNFAILYRMQPGELARRLGVDYKTAENIIKNYHHQAAQATTYIDDICFKAVKDNFVDTAFGRRRFLPELKLLVPAEKAQNIGTFRAWNGRFQGKVHEVLKTAWHHHNSGTAAEILKIKQIRTKVALEAEGLWGPGKTQVGLNMYDELILIVPEKDLNRVTEVATQAFQKPIYGFINPEVTVKSGKNWKEVSK